MLWFSFKRTKKVVAAILFLNLMSLITDLSTLSQYYPYVLITAMIFDFSDWSWLRLERLWEWLAKVVAKRVAGGKISKKWDLEEKINDNMGKIRFVVVVSLACLWLFLRFVANVI